MSIQRPLKPKRLPSEVENPYFRAWALRGSEGISASGRGGADYSNPTSPYSLPTTRYASSPRPSRGDRLGLRSESSLPSSPLVLSPSHFVAGSEDSGLLNRHEEETATGDRSSSINTSVSGGPASRKSSAKSRIHKLFSFSHESTEPKTESIKEEPPEEHKKVKWKGELSGHFIEIHVGRKRPSQDTSAQSPHVVQANRRLALPGSVPQTPLTGPPRYFPILEHPSPPEILVESTPVISRPKVDLPSKPRNILGFPHRAKSPASLVATRTATGDVLEKASHALRQMIDTSQAIDKQSGKESSSSRSTSASTVSVAARRWRRPHLGAEGHSTNSSSTSQFSLPMGVPPASTPNPSATYEGSDHGKYLAVDISDPHGPAFLPSEAKRISTPPLVHHMHSKSSKLRGFFFDYTSPDIPIPEEAHIEIPASFKERSVTQARRSPQSDWYRAKMNSIEAEDGEARESGERSREDFVLQVPEHLPSSPMCPRNPKHKSGGKGVCVYHGRNTSRRGTLEEDHGHTGLDWGFGPSSP